MTKFRGTKRRYATSFRSSQCSHYDADGVVKWPRPRPLPKPLGDPRSMPGAKPRPPRGAKPPREGPPLGSNPPRNAKPPRSRGYATFGPFAGEAALTCPLAGPFSLNAGADLLAGIPPRTAPAAPPRPGLGKPFDAQLFLPGCRFNLEHALLARITWSSDDPSSLHANTNQHRGPWAGDRFCISTLDKPDPRSKENQTLEG